MNEIILVGNPNVGKTTLFNTLTGADEKVSNWHGVTVGVKSKNCKDKNREILVTDLPGLYSLDGFSNEEKIAKEYLLKHNNNLIFNICDANNLIRNLKLTAELLNYGFNVVVLVNMCEENKNFDYKKLSQNLGVPVVEIDARDKQITKGLFRLYDTYSKEKTQKIFKNTKIQLNYNDLIKNIAINQNINPYQQTDKIDKFVLNKGLFLLLFLTVIFLIFYLTFGHFGNFVLKIFEIILNKILDFLRYLINCTNMSGIIKTFIFDVLFDGVFSVFLFLPQIVLLMLFLNILEETGFMSRVAFMFDGMLKKIGLSGKSLFSLSLGFGCTTSAVMASRNLENKNLRRKTVLLLPFVSCSAKLPIFLVLASLFFEKYKYFYVFLVYLFSLFLMCIFALIYKKFLQKKDEIFILEMPKYRLPNLSKILKDIWIVVKDFLLKVGTVLLVFNVLVWLVQNFSFKLEYLNGQNFEKSILYNFSSKLVPIFKPIGLGNVGVIVSILLGVVAKEMVVVGLMMMNGVSGSAALLGESLLIETSLCHFDFISSIVFLVFVLIYSPCISALLTIKNELGNKVAIYVFVAQFVIAYLVAFLVYHILRRPYLLIVISLVIVLDILFCVVLKLKHKNKCRGNCSACRKI